MSFNVHHLYVYMIESIGKFWLLRKRGIDLKKRSEKSIAELLIEFIIFFAVMFFTCTVGIIELLSEFDKIDGIFGWIAISTIYFGLLAGIIFSIDKCFWLYEQNKRFAGKLGFNFPELEPFYLKGKRIERLLIITILLIFTMLYLVKIRVLQ